MSEQTMLETPGEAPESEATPTEPSAPRARQQQPTEEGGKTTTYTVLQKRDDESFAYCGNYTVGSGRSDLAKSQALNDLAAGNPEATAFELVAIPVHSFKVERYEKEPPAPPAFKPVAE